MSNVAQPQPYIGITGITDQCEIETITGKWLDDLTPLPDGYCFMNGILVSSTTFAGNLSESRRYPPIDTVPDLMPDHPQVINTIHYNITGLRSNPSLAKDLMFKLEALVSIIPEAQAIQLNMRWPDVDQLQRFRTRNSKGPQLILQLGGRALADCPTEDDLVERVKPYEGIVERILLDASGGNGRPLHYEDTARRLDALQKADLSLLLGVAGGLSSDSMLTLRRLLAICPRLSWDAEGRLRDTADELDMGTCFLYLSGSTQLLGSLLAAA